MRRIVVLGLSLLLGACTAPRAVAPVSGGAPTELKLKAGDEIRVVTRNRDRLTFEITEVRPTELVGTTLKPKAHETHPKGQSVVVPYEDLAFVVVDRFSAPRTAVAVPVAILLVAAGIVVQAGGFAVMPAPPPPM
jgi:hypothetical protein